jgi:hypothetical protein
MRVKKPPPEVERSQQKCKRLALSVAKLMSRCSRLTDFLPTGFAVAFYLGDDRHRRRSERHAMHCGSPARLSLRSSSQDPDGGSVRRANIVC